MIKFTTTACIEASKEDTWKYLSDIENINLWSESVLSATCKDGVARGVGATRTCHLKGNIMITETWIEWKEGHSYTYLGFNLPLVKTARNKWSVLAQDGKTLLTSQAEVELKGGFLGKLLEPIMLIMSRRMGSDALAAFKFLVENGRPFSGKHALLPRALASC